MSDSSTTSIPDVSMSNTKKEMLEAYQTVKSLIEEKDQQLLDAEKAKDKMRKEVTEEIASEALSKDPVERIQELKSAVIHQLNDLSDKMEAEKERYAKICEAIEDKQKEIQTLYEVETAAQDLAALIEAQRRRKQEFDQSLAQKREVLEGEIAATRDTWEKEKEAQETRRQREQEEYEYELKRERDQRRNALEDELAVLEKKIVQEREVHEKAVAEKQVELERRENEVAERERHANELQRQVDAFPQELDNEVKAAVEEVAKRLQTEREQQLALRAKEFEGERNVLTSRIEGLEKLVQTQNQQIEQLSKQQEKAYEKVQDIANRAVERAANIITVPTQSSSPTLPKD